jgi:endonuclease/exonuclease/phosphatase family metal-dependent hydrolase
MPLRVLTWNLKHGRAVQSAGHYLFDEFAAAIAGWPWDVALLQEVPPWWPAQLGYEHALVLTSRNFGLALRRAVAVRRPDLIKSNGGGANAVLTRDQRIVERRSSRLRRLPERRWLIGAQLDSGLWVGNVHASGRGTEEVKRGAAALQSWAGKRPIVFGGDFNLRALELDGFAWAGGNGVDHIFVRGLEPVAPAQVLERGRLSDHDPVLVYVD